MRIFVLWFFFFCPFAPSYFTAIDEAMQPLRDETNVVVESTDNFQLNGNSDSNVETLLNNKDVECNNENGSPKITNNKASVNQHGVEELYDIPVGECLNAK